MDLVQFLRMRLARLGDGPHSAGLQAVLQHIEVATRHLQRGSEETDGTSFTDAVYRTNQAFEGSLKEAYRVLSGKDPEKARPFDIEAYLQSNSVVRPLVVEQMTRYRTAWRNPSTHNYKLDFDDDEALLAIVSVCALAVVLVDQIAERLSFDRAKAAAAAPVAVTGSGLADLIADSLLTLDLRGFRTGTLIQLVHTTQAIGAIAGHLAAILPAKVAVQVDAPLGERLRADLLVASESERVLVEVKRDTGNRMSAISQLSQHLRDSGLRGGVLFIFDNRLGALERNDQAVPDIGARIIILAPPQLRRT